MSEKRLREILDRITRDVTQECAGIRLAEGGSGPEGELWTVYTGFRRGFHSSLSLRADKRMLTRLAQSMLRTEKVTPQDLEDVAKEYLNVLCGHITRAMYQATNVASRFGVPSFHPGRFSPQGQKEQFALNYIDGRNGAAQLVHHIPDHDNILGNEEYAMKKRVMVVDDSRIQEVQIRNLLEDSEYEVAAYCRSGEDALAAYGDIMPDVVTMDIIMPGMDGLETANALLEVYPEARIIMVSSLAYDDTFEEAQRIGAKGFLDKPFARDQLLEALDKAMA